MTFRSLVLLALLVCHPAAAIAATSLEQLVPDLPDWVEDEPAALEPSGDWDWVQYDTNEWIKGEIIALYDDTLEFDSDNFGLLSIDWGDIIEVRSGRSYRIGLDQGDTDFFTSLYDADSEDVIIGRLYINQNTAYVTGDNGKQWTIERAKILTITTGAPTEANYWSLTASIGVTINSGNTESESTNIFLNAKRRTVNTRVILDYTGIIEETNNDETANNHRLRGIYDIFQTRNFFYRPIFLEYYQDDFQNLDSRITYTPGIGFFLVDEADVDWDITFGPSYQESRFITVQAGSNRTESSTGLGVISTANIDITPDIEWYLEYTLQTADEKTGGDTQRFFTSFDIELTDQFDFQISYMLDHVESPVPDENGVAPENTDTRLMFSLAYEY